MLQCFSGKPVDRTYVEAAENMHTTFRVTLAKVPKLDPAGSNEDAVVMSLASAAAKYKTLSEYAHERAHNDKKHAVKYPEDRTVYGEKHAAKKAYIKAHSAFAQALAAKLNDDLAVAKHVFDQAGVRHAESSAAEVRRLHVPEKKRLGGAKAYNYFNAEIAQAREHVLLFETLNNAYRCVVQTGDLGRLKTLRVTPEQYLESAMPLPQRLSEASVREIEALRAEKLAPLGKHAEHVTLQLEASAAVDHFVAETVANGRANHAQALHLIDRLARNEKHLTIDSNLSEPLTARVAESDSVPLEALEQAKRDVALWAKHGVTMAPPGSVTLERMESLEAYIGNKAEAKNRSMDEEATTA